MIPDLSRHPKYASLASQQCARWLRSGAIGVPSDDIFGLGGDAFDSSDHRKPIERKDEIARATVRTKGCLQAIDDDLVLPAMVVSTFPLDSMLPMMTHSSTAQYQ